MNEETTIPNNIEIISDEEFETEKEKGKIIDTGNVCVSCEG